MARITKDHLEALRLLDEAHLVLEAFYSDTQPYTVEEVFEIDRMIMIYLRRIGV